MLRSPMFRSLPTPVLFTILVLALVLFGPRPAGRGDRDSGRL